MKENNPQNRYVNVVFAIFAGISCFFIAADFAAPARFGKRLVYYALFPSIESAAFFTAKSGTAFEGIREMVYFRQQNIDLKKQNIQLLDKLRSLQGVAEENERLSRLLNLPLRQDTKAVFARVVLREPTEWYKWMIINAGARDGITQGLAVIGIAPDGTTFAVGRIVEVFTSTAKVALITNPMSVVPVQFASSGVDCLAEGTGTRHVKLTYIPEEVQILIGDNLYTSPLSSVFTAQTPVGRVEQILPDEMIGYKTALASVRMYENKTYEIAVIVPVRKEKTND